MGENEGEGKRRITMREREGGVKGKDKRESKEEEKDKIIKEREYVK